MRRVIAEGVFKIGKELIVAQERLANYGNGIFRKWCRDRCGISPSCLQRDCSVRRLLSGRRLTQACNWQLNRDWAVSEWRSIVVADRPMESEFGSPCYHEILTLQ